MQRDKSGLQGILKVLPKTIQCTRDIFIYINIKLLLIELTFIKTVQKNCILNTRYNSLIERNKAVVF